MTIKLQAQETVQRLKNAWVDMDYAQQRLVEIRLGIPPEQSARQRNERARIEELEALYRLQAPAR